MERNKYFCPPELKNGLYGFIKLLAAGGQGYVAQYQNRTSGEMVAVKF